MYAWENAFVKAIKTLAHQEHFAYISTHFQYVFLRGTTFFSQMWASAVFFIIMHYGGFYELDISIMLSTLQLAAFARFFCVTLSSFGLDFIANLNIVLERMKIVLSMEEI
jgi:ATP-binding cassette subfamily C (CFTR/MRP) protein 4